MIRKMVSLIISRNSLLGLQNRGKEFFVYYVYDTRKDDIFQGRKNNRMEINGIAVNMYFPHFVSLKSYNN